VIALHRCTSTTAVRANDSGSGGAKLDADVGAAADTGLVFDVVVGADADADAGADAALSGRKKTVKRKLASTAWSLAELRVKRMSSSAAYGMVSRTFSQKRRRRA